LTRIEAAELSLQSADGTALFARRWRPAAAIRSEVLLVHGLGEHGGRYQGVAQHLVAAGHGVTAVDLRGHGRSAGRRGHVRDFDEYVADVVAAADGIGAVHVLGHSMGGLVAVRLVLAQPARILSVVLSAPFFGIAEPPPPWFDRGGRLLARVWPTKAMRDTIDPERLTRDPAAARAYLDDPLVHSEVTLRWYLVAMAAIQDTLARAVDGTAPLLLLLPGEDRVVDRAASVRLVARWRGPTEVRRWPPARHELFHEVQPDRTEALDATRDWFARHEDAAGLP